MRAASTATGAPPGLGPAPGRGYNGCMPNSSRDSAPPPAGGIWGGGPERPGRSNLRRILAAVRQRCAFAPALRLRLVRHACAVLGQAANPRARVLAARI